MRFDLSRWAPLTVLAIAVVLIVVIVGAILVITGHYNGEYKAWLDDLKVVAAGLGIGVGVGRGIHLASR